MSETQPAPEGEKIGSSGKQVLSWLVERSGISGNPKIFVDKVFDNERRALGRLFQNSSSAERYFGTRPEQDDFRAILNAMQQAVERVARYPLKNISVKENSKPLVNYLRTLMAHKKTEQFMLASLDRDGLVINDGILHRGSVDHTPVYPREVANFAINHGADSIIMVHNHPSDHTYFSIPDIEMTRMIEKALEGIGIGVYDHFLVTPSGHRSFLDQGLFGESQSTPAIKKENLPGPKVYSGSLHDYVPQNDLPLDSRPVLTPEWEDLAQKNLQPFLSDENAAKFVSDEALFSWLIWRFKIAPNPSSIAKTLIAEKGSLGSLVHHSSSIPDSQYAGECRELLAIIKKAQEGALEQQVHGPTLIKWDALMGYLKKNNTNHSNEITTDGDTAQRFLFLDRMNRLISDERLEMLPGTEDPQFIRQTIARGLDLDASAIIEVGNLDQKRPNPTKRDGERARLLQDALGRIGMVLHDKILVNGNGYQSFKSLGLLR